MAKKQKEEPKAPVSTPALPVGEYLQRIVRSCFDRNFYELYLRQPSNWTLHYLLAVTLVLAAGHTILSAMDSINYLQKLKGLADVAPVFTVRHGKVETEAPLPLYSKFLDLNLILDQNITAADLNTLYLHAAGVSQDELFHKIGHHKESLPLSDLNMVIDGSTIRRYLTSKQFELIPQQLLNWGMLIAVSNALFLGVLMLVGMGINLATGRGFKVSEVFMAAAHGMTPSLVAGFLLTAFQIPIDPLFGLGFILLLGVGWVGYLITSIDPMPGIPLAPVRPSKD